MTVAYTIDGSPRKRLRSLFLGMSQEEASFARRGFHLTSEAARVRLEDAGRSLIHGYMAALDSAGEDELTRRLGDAPNEYLGFAFAGAAMGFALQDLLTLGRPCRLAEFISRSADSHLYMAHVGAGWAMARIPWGHDRLLRQLHPLYRWLAFDGLGFHAGYFHWPRFVTCRQKMPRLSGYAARVFDQGLGRSLWFVNGVNPVRIATAIGGFERPRHGDLWSGIGLAAAYIGGISDDGLRQLGGLSRTHFPALAQGVAFAAATRQRAGNPAGQTDRACEALCDCSAADAAMVTDLASQNLPAFGPTEAYEVWRQRIQKQLPARLGGEVVAT